MRILVSLWVVFAGITPCFAEETWNKLARGMAVEQPDFSWKKTYPSALSDGMDFEVTGYIVPIEAQAYFTTFLLVDDPLNCPYCGTGESYGPVLEVQLARPVPETEEFAQVTVAGQLEFVIDKETSQLFRLTEARVLK